MSWWIIATRQAEAPVIKFSYNKNLIGNSFCCYLISGCYITKELSGTVLAKLSDIAHA